MLILKTKWTERKRISKERMKICETCDEYDDGMCKECGCVLEIKTMFPYSDCPLNKWNSYEENENG